MNSATARFLFILMFPPGIPSDSKYGNRPWLQNRRQNGSWKPACVASGSVRPIITHRATAPDLGYSSGAHRSLKRPYKPASAESFLKEELELTRLPVWYQSEEPLESAVRYVASLSPHFNWVGIYLLKGKFLELGPFVGAETDHTRIPIGRGVCGTAISENRDQNVPDVTSSSNYLASASPRSPSWSFRSATRRARYLAKSILIAMLRMLRSQGRAGCAASGR